MSSYIALLDPSLLNHQGDESRNLGDLIIYESIAEELALLFPSKEVVRISSHVALEGKHRKLINEAFLSFVGGTNLLTSDMTGFRQLYIKNGRLVWLFPGVKDLVLIGAGWGDGYGERLSFKTKMFYTKLFHKDFFHSIRDQYSSEKLQNEASLKTLNTTCPTMWNLPDLITNRTKTTSTCLFTLTDYDRNTEADEKLIKIILDHFNNLIFFPQGSEDYSYLTNLPIYQKNKSKVTILAHSYPEFKQYIAANTLTYIGTRLHSGIKCLQHNHESFIVAIDNRATEIAKDTNLAICSRGNYSPLLDWLTGKQTFKKNLTIPVKEIVRWKNQFS